MTVSQKKPFSFVILGLILLCCATTTFVGANDGVAGRFSRCSCPELEMEPTNSIRQVIISNELIGAEGLMEEQTIKKYVSAIEKSLDKTSRFLCGVPNELNVQHIALLDQKIMTHEEVVDRDDGPVGDGPVGDEPVADENIDNVDLGKEARVGNEGGDGVEGFEVRRMSAKPKKKNVNRVGIQMNPNPSVTDTTIVSEKSMNDKGTGVRLGDLEFDDSGNCDSLPVFLKELENTRDKFFEDITEVISAVIDVRFGDSFERRMKKRLEVLAQKGRVDWR